jgi:hypothetical protein
MIQIGSKQKVKKPLTKLALLKHKKKKEKIAMKRLYDKNKPDPEYIERQRLSSRTHIINITKKN